MPRPPPPPCALDKMGRECDGPEGAGPDAARGRAPGVLLHLLPGLLHQALQGRADGQEVAPLPQEGSHCQLCIQQTRVKPGAALQTPSFEGRWE